MKKNSLVYILFVFILFACNKQDKTNTNGTSVVSNNSEETPKAKESNLKKSLQWTAYKTNNKIPVDGTFMTLSLTQTQDDKPSLEEALQGAQFSCDGTSVSTGDTSRDGTLVTFFFKRLPNPEIKGSFGKFENNKVSVTFLVNGKSVTKEYDYSVKNNEITISGTIDIIKDFDAEKAFTSLHRACYDLHEGKTWTEVDFKVKISR